MRCLPTKPWLSRRAVACPPDVRRGAIANARRAEIAAADERPASQAGASGGAPRGVAPTRLVGGQFGLLAGRAGLHEGFPQGVERHDNVERRVLRLRRTIDVDGAVPRETDQLQPLSRCRHWRSTRRGLTSSICSSERPGCGRCRVTLTISALRKRASMGSSCRRISG